MASRYDPIKTAQLIQKYQDQYNQAATRKLGASSDSNSRRMYYAANKLRELGGKVPDIDRPMYGLAYKPTMWERMVYKGVTPAAGQYYQRDLSPAKKESIKAQYDTEIDKLQSSYHKSRDEAKAIADREEKTAARDKALEDYMTARRDILKKRSEELRGYVPANVKQETPATPTTPAASTNVFQIPRYTYQPGVGYTKEPAMKAGGKVKSHRGDGIAQRGKTRGRMV